MKINLFGIERPLRVDPLVKSQCCIFLMLTFSLYKFGNYYSPIQQMNLKETFPT